MSIFKNIDTKLITLSNDLNAKLSIDRDWMPNAGFEELRLCWYCHQQP